jgi:hypothetical protein
VRYRKVKQAIKTMGTPGRRLLARSYRHQQRGVLLDVTFLCITQQYVLCELFSSILQTGIKYTIPTGTLNVLLRNIKIFGI